jgi:hypothetical protein
MPRLDTFEPGPVVNYQEYQVTVREKRGNELYHGVTAVIWSDECVTMSRAVDHRVSRRDLLVSNVAQMMTLSPEGRTLELRTSSI